MGYTHYYYLKDFEDFKMPGIAEDIGKLIATSEVVIVGPNGGAGTEPEINDNFVAFNGEADEGCETFYYPDVSSRITKGFSFTKTYRRPYDEVVAASFLVLKHHMGKGISIHSDGKYWEDEWQDAIALYQKCFPDREVPQLDRHEDEDEDAVENVTVIA